MVVFLKLLLLILNIFKNAVAFFGFNRIYILHSDPSMYQIKQINLQYISLADEGASAEHVVHISAKFSLHFVMNVIMINRIQHRFGCGCSVKFSY